MRRLHRLIGGAALLLVLLATMMPSAALAHERRPIAGQYQFIVGFLNEPAIADEMNGIDLRVSKPGENNKPVEGLADTLKAEVIVGGGASVMPVKLAARFGQPGAYAGYFIPTRSGAYIFHISGTVEGNAVDERFESGPGRFNDVESAQPLQFPDKLADPALVASQLQAARDEAATARTLAIVGLLAGLLGLAASAAVLTTNRRAHSQVARPQPSESS